LRLGVVDVVQVDGIEPEVRERAVELVVDERRCDAVVPADEVGPVDQTGVDVLVVDPPPRVGWSLAVEGDEPPLGRDDDGLPVDVGVGERTPDDALAALVAVVDRRVDDVYTRFDGRDDSLVVGVVGRVGRVAEVGTQADAGDDTLAEPAKVRPGELLVEPLAVVPGPRSGRHTRTALASSKTLPERPGRRL
jgi:hypothetical protein